MDYGLLSVLSADLAERCTAAHVKADELRTHSRELRAQAEMTRQQARRVRAANCTSRPMTRQPGSFEDVLVNEAS